MITFITIKSGKTSFCQIYVKKKGHYEKANFSKAQKKVLSSICIMYIYKGALLSVEVNTEHKRNVNSKGKILKLG